MTIKLPTPLRTYQYRPLTVFSLLDTDTDRVLPQLFETCVKGGRSSRSRTRAGDFAGYRDALIDGGTLVGFDDDGDRALLDGWLRSCVVDMGAVGRSKSGEQMLAVAPLTLAAYRAGLPKERTRHRGIDDAVYHFLLDAVERGGATSATGELRELVTRTVGRGLSIGPPPRWEPQIADVGQLDIGALLEFRFVEGFEMPDATPIATDDRYSVACRCCAARRHAAGPPACLRRPPAGPSTDVQLCRPDGSGRVHLQPADRRCCRDCCCAPANLPAGHALRRRRHAAQPNLELYCDFTGDRGSVSDGLSRRCVERDLDRVRLAFRDRMTFLVIEQALEPHT